MDCVPWIEIEILAAYPNIRKIQYDTWTSRIGVALSRSDAHSWNWGPIVCHAWASSQTEMEIDMGSNPCPMTPIQSTSLTPMTIPKIAKRLIIIGIAAKMIIFC